VVWVWNRKDFSFCPPFHLYLLQNIITAMPLIFLPLYCIAFLGIGCSPFGLP